MIIPVGPLEAPGGGGGVIQVAEYNFSPSSGETAQIPQSDALIINVLLWPEAPIADLQLVLPQGMRAGRRIFIYTDQGVSQMTVTAEAGAFVANGVVSLNMYDLVVFNTVSASNKIWARVATS